jgi:hypothetical protein
MTRFVEPGDRIELVSMPDDPDPIQVGSRGTVKAVSRHPSWIQVSVDWDSGRKLMLTCPPDRFRLVRAES